jgi:hypothetical protein
MDRTPCTEPQYLYKGDFYPFFLLDFLKISVPLAEIEIIENVIKLKFQSMKFFIRGRSPL